MLISEWAEMPYPSLMKLSSFRRRLRAFQAMLGDAPDPAFIAALEYLENRDLDLSIRIGGCWHSMR